MLRSLHDGALSDALNRITPVRVVGIQGGHHPLERGSAPYTGTAKLGRRLSRDGLTLRPAAAPVRGRHGPRAYTVPAEDTMLDATPEPHSKAPRFKPSVSERARSAFEALRSRPGSAPSVAVPS